MKTKRHSKIMELIQNYDISTQEDLLEYLKQEGFDVTQATVSRDIKELHLVKTMLADGKYKYSETANSDGEKIGSNYAVFAQSIKSVDYAKNMVVIKCFTGMANAACVVLDTMNQEGMVGTLAGDDTIFACMRTDDYARDFANAIEKNILR